MSTAPPSMDRAYERTKPVWVRRNRPDRPPIPAASAADGSVDAVVVDEDQHPGQPLAGTHEDRLVGGVGVEVGPRGAGDRGDLARGQHRHRTQLVTQADRPRPRR